MSVREHAHICTCMCIVVHTSHKWVLLRNSASFSVSQIFGLAHQQWQTLSLLKRLACGRPLSEDVFKHMLKINTPNGDLLSTNRSLNVFLTTFAVRY